MSRSRLHCLTTFVLATTVALLARGGDKPRFAGPSERGFLLPNGWTITPAGEQVILTDLPLNIVPTPDGRHALVATSGYNAHELSLVDLPARKVVASQAVRQSWYGLACDAASGRVWWSGGGANLVHTFAREGETLASRGPNEPVMEKRRDDSPRPHHFKSGLLFNPQDQILYSLDIEAGEISAHDLNGASPDKVAPAGIRPYDVVLARNRSRLYVSDWASRTVLALDPNELRTVARIPVGEHPNQIAVHPKDDRIFVACASSNSVAVIDTRRGVVTETVVTSLFPLAPEGSTPDALAVAPDGTTLFVANADNNCVAVIDVSTPNRSQVKGFIPTGWYPTAVAVSPDGKSLLVGVGKGNQTRPNPIGSEKAEPENGKAKTYRPRLPYPYIGTTLSGALSIVAVPDEKQLAAFTETVYRNCPYSDTLLTGTPYPHKTAIPTKVGDPSLIKHVIYIIKENRTYDQVFGDLSRGNGDSALVMFGETVTPNHHKLAEEFVLLDNLYCNGHVSADGHPWSTMAYGTDYIARNWALTYSRRTGIDDDDEGDLSKAPSGYLWDACARHNLTYRSYGEYGRRVSQPDGSFRIEALVPGLVGHMCPDFGAVSYKGLAEVDLAKKIAEDRELISNLEGALSERQRLARGLGDAAIVNRRRRLNEAQKKLDEDREKLRQAAVAKPVRVEGGVVRDTDRVETFLEEFRDFEKNGNLPRFIVMSLGEDHTSGTRPGAFTPRACVASNDLALGRLVDAVSRSKYWPETAIFVIEDDAQNGPDHVDAHRTVGLVVSPYTKRHHLDSTQYSTVSMIRTIELILGLSPLSQFDAAASPMFASFTDKADLTPYSSVPARIDLETKNDRLAYGAARSERMDFSEYDKIDDFELNEILWRAVKGKDAPIPPAVRRAIAFRPAQPAR
jgi:YVTN family beta-propeller protein